MVRAAVLAWGLALCLAKPAWSAPTLRALVETIDLSGAAISPDGEAVAFRQDQADIALNRRILTWWIAPMSGRGPPRRIADGGGALWSDAGRLETQTPQWSPDSRWIYFRALIDGQVQVWRASADGAASEQVTHDDADVQAFALTDKGRRLVYSVGASREAIVRAEAKAYDQGVRIDKSVDPGQSLFAAAEVNGRLAAQRLTGRWFSRSGLLADQPATLRAVDLASLSARAATEEEAAKLAAAAPAAASGMFEPAALQAASADGFGVVSAQGPPGGRSLRVLRPDGSERVCAAQACVGHSLAALVWRPGRDQVVVTTNDAARRQSLALWTVETGEVRAIASGPGLLYGGGEASAPCAVGQAALVCVAESPLMAPRLRRIDLQSRASADLAAPNQGLDADAAERVTALEWRDPSGRLFTGQLLRPPGSGRAPLFITYYVCDGFLRGGVGDEWPLASLAGAGIAVLCVNKAAEPADGQDAAADYAAALSGVRSAIDRLAGEGLIDPSRVGMGGLSFGAEAATWIAMNSDLLAAVSIATPPLEPAYYWINGAAGRDNHAVLERVWGLGAPEATPERWRRISPALNAARIRAPVLMQYSEQEYRAGLELFARLSNSATPSELWVFANEPHQKTQPRHRLAVYQRNFDWFRFWLLGQSDPAPAKQAQYARWRSMAQARGRAAPSLAQGREPADPADPACGRERPASPT